MQADNLSARYYLSRDWSRDNVIHEAGTWIARNSLTGERLSLSTEALKLLEAFGEEGNTIDEAAAHLGLDDQEKAELIEAVNKLADYRLLISDCQSFQVVARETALPDLTAPDCRFVDCETLDGTELTRNDIAIIGLPIDLATSGSPGARYGPKYIREWSRRLATYERHIINGLNKGWYNADLGAIVFQGTRFVDMGDVTSVPGENFSVTMERCYRVATQIFQSNCMPIFLGGDHSISAPLIKACAEHYHSIVVLHLDAHTDNAEWTPTTNHHHGSVISRIIKENESVEVFSYGVRGFSGSTTSGDRLHVVRQTEIDQDFSRAISLLPRDRICYISLDLDVVDPVFAPGTGTPVPLGMEPKTLLRILRAFANQNRIVGIDVVELAPEIDLRDTTTNLATHTLLYMAALAYDNYFKFATG